MSPCPRDTTLSIGHCQSIVNRLKSSPCQAQIVREAQADIRDVDVA